MISYPPCLNCIHWHRSPTCDAYPDGIPYPIIGFGRSHDRLRGDEEVEVVFELDPARAKQHEARLKLIEKMAGRSREEAS